MKRVLSTECTHDLRGGCHPSITQDMDRQIDTRDARHDVLLRCVSCAVNAQF